MRIRLVHWSRLLIVCAVVGTVAPMVYAQDLGLQLHGFGGWYYGRSNDVQFLEAAKGGNAQTAQFALNAAIKPTDRLRVVSQVNFQQLRDDNKVELDYAFAEFDLASRLRVRAGRAKHPWGIYGEIFDVGTARPFQHLSQAIYGPQGFTGKAYNGIGLTGSVGNAAGWNLLYDLYAGEIDAEYEESGLFSVIMTPTLSQKFTFHATVKDTVGTRLMVNTPIEGLSFGGSGYQGKENLSGYINRQQKAYMGSVEYLNDRFLLRTEVGHITAEKDVDQNAGYAEAAFKITEHWQLAARYDRLHRELTALQNLPPQYLPGPIPPFISSRFDVSHTERVVGLNYWVTPNMVLRASYSKVKGAALLYPSVQDLQMLMMTGVLPSDEANLILVGTHFSF